MSQYPSTPEEWQLAVDLAECYLLIESARAYGLVTGGPKVNTKRCEEILRRGAEMAIWPREDAIRRLTPELVKENGT